jgi:hypothetical protein
MCFLSFIELRGKDTKSKTESIRDVEGEKGRRREGKKGTRRMNMTKVHCACVQMPQ